MLAQMESRDAESARSACKIEPAPISNLARWFFPFPMFSYFLSASSPQPNTRPRIMHLPSRKFPLAYLCLGKSLLGFGRLVKSHGYFFSPPPSFFSFFFIRQFCKVCYQRALQDLNDREIPAFLHVYKADCLNHRSNLCLVVHSGLLIFFIFFFLFFFFFLSECTPLTVLESHAIFSLSAKSQQLPLLQTLSKARRFIKTATLLVTLTTLQIMKQHTSFHSSHFPRCLVFHRVVAY